RRDLARAWSLARRDAPQNRSGTLPLARRPPDGLERPATGRSDQARAWSHERREAPQNRSGTWPPPRPPLGVGDLSDRGYTEI
ncbi:MAG: hypothetical protein V3U45_01040, partial [bacterium]